MPPLETLPPSPGDPSGGVFYLRIVLSPEEASRPWVFLNSIFFLRGGVVSASPNTQAGGPPLVGCPRLLIQFIRSYPPCRRPFLHLQPEDAPCCGDRDPQTRRILTYTLKLYALSATILHFVWHYLCLRFWISFGMGTMPLTWRLRNCVSVMGRGIVLFSPKYPDWLWDKSILLFNEYRWFETGNSLPSITKAKNKWIYTFVPHMPSWYAWGGGTLLLLSVSKPLACQYSARDFLSMGKLSFLNKWECLLCVWHRFIEILYCFQ